jgi:hypothetical protein
MDIRAFNTSWLFSFCGRTLFLRRITAPGVEVGAGPPFALRLAGRAATVLHAESSDTTPAADERTEVWAGPTFLSGKTTAPKAPRKRFFALLGAAR